MNRKSAKKAAIILFWLLLWQVIALFVHNPIYFAGPVETAAELAAQAATADFWLSVAASLLRIVTGFFAAAAAAFILGFLSFRYPFFEEFISPVIALLKSVPVAAVVVILLIWWGPAYLVLAISFMVIFPNIYGNLLTGLKETDPALLEMAKVFDISVRDRLLWIYRPAYLPYVASAFSFSLGMGFKSGVAAEIIALPAKSIGEQLYRDKIYLNTAGVFAWMVVILVLSALMSRLLQAATTRVARIPAPILDNAVVPESGKESDAAAVHAAGLVKGFGERRILDLELDINAGEICCLMGPSGSGKTTLMRILAGLLEPDGGTAGIAGAVRMVFQEDRLINSANAVRNLKLAGCEGDLRSLLSEILPDEIMDMPVAGLSGGEKRRVAIARAVLSPCGVLLLDEPFTGMDAATKERTIKWILDHRRGRTVLAVSHDEEDAALLGGRIIRLENGGI